MLLLAGAKKAANQRQQLPSLRQWERPASLGCTKKRKNMFYETYWNGRRLFIRFLFLSLSLARWLVAALAQTGDKNLNVCAPARVEKFTRLPTTRFICSHFTMDKLCLCRTSIAANRQQKVRVSNGAGCQKCCLRECILSPNTHTHSHSVDRTIYGSNFAGCWNEMKKKTWKYPILFYYFFQCSSSEKKLADLPLLLQTTNTKYKSDGV